MDTQQNKNRREQGDFRQYPMDKEDHLIPNMKLSFCCDWWIKVTIGVPACVYYFGPFDSLLEASEYEAGYREDLINEGALDISIDIMRDLPSRLTISLD